MAFDPTSNPTDALKYLLVNLGHSHQPKVTNRVIDCLRKAIEEDPELEFLRDRVQALENEKTQLEIGNLALQEEVETLRKKLTTASRRKRSATSTKKEEKE